MRTVRTVAELREVRDQHRRAGHTVGLVPTMGAFHEGHLSLMRRARAENDVVVVSLFVNPTQFNERGDLEGYPRDEPADAAQAQAIGVDILFAPPVHEVYPDGFATTVSVARVTERLEGAHRGLSHFDGVATVVTKLLNMVGPDVAYFGQKDAQQSVVIRQLVRDLDIPVRIEVCPTVREPDGLALSSRNRLLTDEQRFAAPALHRALSLAQRLVDEGEHQAAAIRARALTELSDAGLEPEYFELVAAGTLTPVAHVEGDVLALVAARAGAVRLIDNAIILNHQTAASAA